jgi:hypothetical protein
MDITLPFFDPPPPCVDSFNTLSMGKNRHFWTPSPLILFVCNRRDTIQYQGGLRSRKLGQAPMLLVFLTPRQALSSHPHQQMVCLYRLQDTWLIVHYNYNTTHTMKPRDPLLLFNGTLCCRMSPTGKVAIS